VPGARWHRTLIGLLTVALLLVGPAPAASAQAEPPADRARQVAAVPDDLWTSPAGASTAGSSSSGGGFPVPVLLLALVVAYAAGLLAAYGAELMPARSGPRPARPEPDPPPPAAPPADGVQEVAIERSDEALQVVACDRRGRRRVVAQSEPVPDERAEAEVRHRLLRRLRAVGWEPRGESRLVRAPAGPGRPPRVAAVEARHSTDETWFTAVALSAYAEATSLAQSPSFHVPDEADPARTVAAAAAHAALLADLKAVGWEPSGTLGPWYATTFRRRATARS
jgi:hypothetical protein